ncbi:MAG: hydrogenase maturation protein [Gammaproteobacteria bacterium]|nr:hydrogenase maturation protein [Gammaproteobacteria bacterium]
MKILLLTQAFNSLSQRLYVELCQRGHQVSVEFDINDRVSIEAVALFRPDLIVAPFLKRAIAREIWANHICLVVHPGIKGDRGPSALDWAILNGERHWGVTLLQANAEMDAGDIWATETFPMRQATKASLYRNEVTEAAVRTVLTAIGHLQQGGFEPEPLDYANHDVRGTPRPLVRQADRAIDWRRDDSQTVLRKIRSGDGFPGVADRLFGRDCFLHDAHHEPSLGGRPGEVIARSGPAICRATVDGSIWIGHLRDSQGAHPFKLPATRVLADETAHLPEAGGYPEISYRERSGVGYLHFHFYNGAMSRHQCERLREAFASARSRDTRVIVLMGGSDFWSNGLHLNLIEAAASPADESWLNINAINDLARDIITTQSHVTISALQGNAGAGGVFLARAADLVWARSGVILNPHYKDMGNLYGSEYWTYLLPKRVGDERAVRITQGRLPMGCGEAFELGLVDACFACGHGEFVSVLEREAELLAVDPGWEEMLAEKIRRRAMDELERPLERYREQELSRMKRNFYGFDPSYHVARYNFVYKVPKSRTPVTIARHRDLRRASDRIGKKRS